MNEVMKDIYQVEIPLKGNPLKMVYSYIILGAEKDKGRECFIVDTGFNSEPCKNALYTALEDLGLSLDLATLIVTHLHSDHSGLAAELNQSGTVVMTGRVDGEMINEMTKDSYWEAFAKRADMMDLRKDGVTFGGHPGYKYCPKNPIKFKSLVEGDLLKMGQYSFEVIDIPGHTPGHIALYDKNHKIMISGDHVLDPITPNIAFWGFEWNILDVYMKSLDKVRAMDLGKILPSHRKIIENHQERIDQLKEHHQERLEEVGRIIEDWTSVRDTASKMHWSLRQNVWTDFPDPQKWFASGEAMSHLEYLYVMGEADRRERNGILEYKMKK